MFLAAVRGLQFVRVSNATSSPATASLAKLMSSVFVELSTVLRNVMWSKGSLKS